jgi:hypothetical protein
MASENRIPLRAIKLVLAFAGVVGNVFLFSHLSSYRASDLTIKNQSSAPVTVVVLQGSRVVRDLGSIAPGDTSYCRVQKLRSDTGLEVQITRPVSTSRLLLRQAARRVRSGYVDEWELVIP